MPSHVEESAYIEGLGAGVGPLDGMTRSTVEAGRSGVTVAAAPSRGDRRVSLDPVC